MNQATPGGSPLIHDETGQDVALEGPQAQSISRLVEAAGIVRAFRGSENVFFVEPSDRTYGDTEFSYRFRNEGMALDGPFECAEHFEQAQCGYCEVPLDRDWALEVRWITIDPRIDIDQCFQEGIQLISGGEGSFIR